MCPFEKFCIILLKSLIFNTLMENTEKARWKRIDILYNSGNLREGKG